MIFQSFSCTVHSHFCPLKNMVKLVDIPTFEKKYIQSLSAQKLSSAYFHPRSVIAKSNFPHYTFLLMSVLTIRQWEKASIINYLRMYPGCVTIHHNELLRLRLFAKVTPFQKTGLTHIKRTERMKIMFPLTHTKQMLVYITNGVKCVMIKDKSWLTWSDKPTKGLESKI